VAALIRPALPADAVAILRVVETAFTDPQHEATVELDIVQRTWELEDRTDVLELVAEQTGAVIGHVQAALGTLDRRTVPVAGVAPLSVAPGHQGEGVGSALMSRLVEAADKRAWAVLVVLGAPGYYGRFGFEPAAALGITYAPVSPGDPHFQARRLAAYEPSLSGAFAYVWE
jgi:putative acetyltransferase